MLLANTPAQAKSLKYSLEQATRGIDFLANPDKIEFVCFKQDGAITTLNGNLLKLIDQFSYISNNISSTESDVNIYIRKTVNDRLIICEPDLSDKNGIFSELWLCQYFCGCTTWTLMK